MRFIHLYLIGYSLIVSGLVLALWHLGLLDRVAPIWILIGILVIIGAGVMMSVRSGKPTITEEIEK